jgi:hypothetical protein
VDALGNPPRRSQAPAVGLAAESKLQRKCNAARWLDWEKAPASVSAVTMATSSFLALRFDPDNARGTAVVESSARL